jgi:hypothetical protein
MAQFLSLKAAPIEGFYLELMNIDTMNAAGVDGDNRATIRGDAFIMGGTTTGGAEVMANNVSMKGISGHLGGIAQ